MIQILQSLKSGDINVAEVPCPHLTSGNVLIRTSCSLISAGTERMLIDFGKASYLEKALQQPDKFKQVLAKVRTDGVMQTIDAVRSKLDQPISLGYCNVGTVLESLVDDIRVGDRVVSNGYHAEIVRVAKNLCVKIPDVVSDDSAAFTVLGAIGLQGIRLANPTLGESFVVSGLGLVGLMTVQMLIANGCKVLGIDRDTDRCELARQFGAEVVDISKGEDPLTRANSFSSGFGVDGVIIAAATKSDEVIHDAAQMCRKRGRIILVGVVGLNLRRDDFFKKEITFQVSASYGPGRYDSNYEEKGQDYPQGFVRWTERRNFEAVLHMMATGVLNVQPLISHKFDIEDAAAAYQCLEKPDSLGLLLQYPRRDESEVLSKNILLENSTSISPQVPALSIKKLGIEPVIGFIGAGNYASRTLIPAFKKVGVSLDTIFTSGGVSGVHHGRKAGFRYASTDLELLWKNKCVNTVVIATRHNLHASQVLDALASGKNIFVEKPLALTIDELRKIEQVYSDIKTNGLPQPNLMIGFNRRFSPLARKLKALLESRHETKVCVMTINAGEISADHWIHDKKIGGGRIIGEGCHFIDLMRFLIGHPISGFTLTPPGRKSQGESLDDNISFGLSFADGSFGVINYLANGGKSFPKERIEVFCGGGVLQLDNFRRLTGFDWRGFKRVRLWKQDKGQEDCVDAFVNSLRNGVSSPIPFDEIIEVSRIAIEISKSFH
jgi:predicted dehydrogenase/threonine dehydrogenase-like Zn-dependent dehydrogenase